MAPSRDYLLSLDGGRKEEGVAKAICRDVNKLPVLLPPQETGVGVPHHERLYSQVCNYACCTSK